MHLGRWICAVALGLAFPAVTAAPAVSSARGCGPSGYAYAGLQSRKLGSGIAAAITALAPPVVQNGHVAAWVGVGSPNEGPGGTAEWIQVGLNSEPGSDGRLYYEVTRPSREPEYVELASDVPAGAQHRVAVLEAAGKPGVWRVWVDGRPASGGIYLPGSHARLTPMAMSESWDGGSHACNRFAYRFRHVALAAGLGGSWQSLQDADVVSDPGYRVVTSPGDGFLAATRAPVPGLPTGQP